MSHATPPSTNLTSNDSMSTHPSQLEMTEHTIQQSQVVFHVEDGETDETMPASTSEGYVSFSPDPLKALSLTDITASPASPVSADEVHGLLKELSVNDEQKSPDGEEVKLNPALAVTTMSIAQLEKHTESQFNFNDLKQSPGISSAEAAKRLLRDGRNALTPPPQRPEIVKYLLQYTDPFMLLLLGAGILTFIAYALDTSQILNLWIGVVLEVAVFLSASFSYITERRAGDAMSAFKKMLPANASVIRDGKRSKIPAVELVVGDIVFVGTGDQVPADMRILASTNMKVEKSSLTGESLPISVGAKCDRSITKIEDAPNIIFNTTQCMEGECIAVVVHTGDRTLIGSIAGMVTNISHKMTPVQKEIHHFVKRLSILAGVLGLIFFIIGLARGKSPIPCFISSFVVVCIACVPEGLPLTALACLSVTAKRMAKKQVFIKQLSSVETLGSVTAIASDKTGTLTQNKMTVVHMWFDQFSMSSSGIQSSFPVHLPSLVTSQNGVGTKAPAVSIGDSAATYNVLELAAVLCNRAKYSDEQPLSDSEATMLERAQLLQGMDPTGSMTMNRLRGNFPTLLGSMEQNLDLSAALKLYTKLGVTASSSSLSEETGVARTVTGDATDSALLQFVATRQSVELLRYHYRTVFEVPFNSRNKYALTIVKPVHVKSHLPSSPSSSDEKPSTTTTGKKALQEAEGRPAGERESSTRLLFLKGAPEVVLSKCSNYLFRGETKPIDGGFRNQFNQAYETFGSRGERVLGFAYLELDPETYSPAYDGLYASELNNFPTEKLTFVGLIALVDPPKPSVPRAVQLCRQAGVKVLMVTGDHALTAAAIARQVNILTQPTAAMLADSMGCLESEVPDSNVQAVVVVGSDLINFTEQDWNRILSKEEVVFARTTPAQKLLIVENLQRLNHLVAVTGDGVNDSPALKRADIGVAMGLMGSDVARDAADVILMDDDFSSIVEGVRQGRNIFDNLAKTIAYTCSHLIPETVPTLLSLAFDFPAALPSLAILAIDLGTELAPAISFAFEVPESDVMGRPPRQRSARLIGLTQTIYIFWSGLLNTAWTWMGFLLVMQYYDVPLSKLPWSSNNYWVANSDPFVIAGPDGCSMDITSTNYDPSCRTLSDVEQVQILAEATGCFFYMLVTFQFFHIFMVKTRSVSVFNHPMTANIVMLYGVIIEAAFIILFLFVPRMNELLVGKPFPAKFFALPLVAWGSCFITSEGRKFISRTSKSQWVKNYLNW